MDPELEQPVLPDSADAANANADHEDDSHVNEHQDDDDDLNNPDPEGQEEEEDEEIEVDGKKLALPKSLAQKLNAERLMHKDYTQKTQAVAEERKAIVAEREQVERHKQEAQQYITELAEVHALDQQIAQHNSLNLNELLDSGQISVEDCIKLRNQLEALQNQRYQKVNSLTQKKQQAELNEKQALANRVQEAGAYLTREIPGWSEGRNRKVFDYAVSQGVPGEVLTEVAARYPVLAKLIHKAELLDQLEQKRNTNKPKAPVQEKPVTRITATRASAQRDPDKMPMEDWLKWRNAQRSKKR